MGETITTDRLELRPHRRIDFEPWRAIYTEAAVMRFLAIAPMSPEEAWNRLLRYAGHWALCGYGMFAVLERRSGLLIGDVGLADFHRGLGQRFDGFAEAAWIFGAAGQGQGYAAEAVEASHRWLEMRRGPARTVCIISPDNAPSLRLANRLNYSPFDRCQYKGAPYIMLERGGA